MADAICCHLLRDRCLQLTLPKISDTQGSLCFEQLNKHGLGFVCKRPLTHTYTKLDLKLDLDGWLRTRLSRVALTRDLDV